jgi:hypothetical protein
MRTTLSIRVTAFGVWVLASSAAHAQSLLGDLGASCAAVPMGGGTHVITLTGDVPAGSAVLIAAGTSGVATFQGATDSAGNSYTTIISRTATFSGFTVYGRIASALGVGQTITLNYSAAFSGQSSCASVAAFRGVDLVPFPPVDTSGQTGGMSSGPVVWNLAGTSEPRELVHAAFALNAAPGGITVQLPSTPLQIACTAGNLFCVVPAYRVVDQTGTHFVNATLGNSVPWVGVLATYLSDVIFADGFQ